MAQRRKTTPTDKNSRDLPWPDAFLQAQALTTNDSYKVGQLLVERVSVTVRDSGIGIASEDQERVFGMFVQLNRDMRRSQTGLGASGAVSH